MSKITHSDIVELFRKVTNPLSTKSEDASMPFCREITNAEYSEYFDSQYEILWLGLHRVQHIYFEIDIIKEKCHHNQNITKY